VAPVVTENRPLAAVARRLGVDLKAIAFGVAFTVWGDRVVARTAAPAVPEVPVMLFDSLLEPFLPHRPAAVMTRAAWEYAFAGDDLDDPFRRTATTPSEHRRTFSRAVGPRAAVVTRRYASVRAAYRADPAALAAPRASGYDSRFAGIAARGSYVVVRHHAHTGVTPGGPLRPAGQTATGPVFEPPGAVGGTACRRVVVRLTHPTRDGEAEVRRLTTRSAEPATAVVVADAYRRRWARAASFLEVTRSARCERATLGDPRAAIRCVALALGARDALRVVTQAVQAAPGADHPGEGVPSSYVANEAAAALGGLEVVVPAAAWVPLRALSGDAFAVWLVVVAGKADWRKYRKTTRGPKKPVAMATAGRKAAHRSTHRLLLAAKGAPEGRTQP
jgi:hypothetical protein